jgi:hypothetical protein
LSECKKIQITTRDLGEAIKTGLSRPPSVCGKYKYRLKDFANVMRGIATGANEYFFLTEAQVRQYDLPIKYFKRAIGRTRDVSDSLLTAENLENLDKNKRPTFLLSLDSSDELPQSVANYLETGKELGLHERSLISQRSPWYKMEKREVPPILFAYLGRRNSRFIKNAACALPLTGFLCVYPNNNDSDYCNNLWQALNHSDTLENLALVGKSYGSGAIKVEPSKLRELPIPEHIVEQFSLK